MPGEIWVVIEQLGDKIELVSLELLGEAARLGETLNAVPCAVALGSPGFLTSKIQQELVKNGARKIYLAEDVSLEHYQSEIFTEILTQAATGKKPIAILVGATANGSDFTPRVAARIGSGLVSNCTDLKTDAEGRLVFIKQIFNGKAQATCAATGPVQIATVRPDMIGLKPNSSSPATEPATAEAKASTKPQLSFPPIPLPPATTISASVISIEAGSPFINSIVLTR